jgi:hypothetical protein
MQTLAGDTLADAQHACRLLSAHAIQVPEDEDGPVFFGQASQTFPILLAVRRSMAGLGAARGQRLLDADPVGPGGPLAPGRILGQSATDVLKGHLEDGLAVRRSLENPLDAGLE